MCGILGSIDLPLEECLLDLIAHRGPDGHGMLREQVGNHQVTLGHRRLAIVDLSDSGAQPMSVPGARKHIVFNGEIYNHADLRGTLDDTRFRGHSDTETLLSMLNNFGIDAAGRLNGIFAFAYLDVDLGKLFLARDPFGIKPLYFSFSSRQFCFASEMEPLLGLVARDIDVDSLAKLMKLRYVPSPGTLFKNINKLRPGHILEIDLSGEQLGCREYPYIESVTGPGSSVPCFAEAADEYGRLFEQAVRRQLMADVEVGVLLSGGVDSALVAACAQRHSDQPLKAFTVGFTGAGGTGADEIDEARETADLLGMEHHTARIGFDDFIATLDECVRIVEEPLATTSIVPMHYLAGLAGSHVKVVMSGQGADEPLGGYGRYQGELYQRYIPTGLARLGSTVAGGIGIRDERILRGLSALSNRSDIERFAETYAVFSDSEIKKLAGRSSSPAKENLHYFYDLLECEKLPTSVARMMALDLRLGLADDLLLYTDKITMRHSLECRVPILDVDLVRFIESLPASYRVRFGKTKLIHKHFAGQSLPESIIHRKKKGFLSPTRDWFKNGDRLRSILIDKNSSFAGFVDLDTVDTIIREHQRGFNRERHIFLLLCLYFWFSAYA